MAAWHVLECAPVTERTDPMSSNCEHCSLRARYERNPRSLLGRLWRWHTGWCPGWKRYLASLSPEDRERLTARYRPKRPAS